MEHETDKQESVADELTGMLRACKIFVKVDKDGFLLDSLAVSDVVNFDCYESIVTSAQRIISLFYDLNPDEVQVDMVFYYKKRSRATRMNPVALETTTDGFRAVAEHPSGEVPLGIVWYNSSEIPIKNNVGEKRAHVSPSLDDQPPDKKIKLNVPPPYRTFMPVHTEPINLGTDKSTNTPFVTEVRKPQKNSGKDGGGENKRLKNVIFQDVKPAKEKVLLADEVKNASRRTKPSQQFQWKDGVSMEVLLHLNGVTERKKLKPSIASVVEKLMKGNFTVLRDDIAAKLRQDDLFVSNQELLHDMNFVGCVNDKPLQYLDEAKLQIIKVLSLVNLTRARFKDLLDWLKTLKLEKSLTGKFFLSERNLVGGGLRVAYDTDQQAAATLNILKKAQSKLKPPQTLFPVTALQPTVGILPSGQQHMFVVPNSTGTVSSAVLKPTSKPMQTEAQIRQSLMPVALTSNVKGQSSSGESIEKELKITNAVSLNPSSKGKNVPSVTASSVTLGAPSPPVSIETLEKLRTSRFPNILRNKVSSHKQKQVTPSPKPVPVKLFKSVKEKTPESGETDNTESDSSLSESPLVVVKMEPIDTYEDVSDRDHRPSYNSVHRSDTQISQKDEQKTDVVVKTERLDDG